MTEPATPPPVNTREFRDLSPRSLAAGMVGNVLEWYDFGLYGYLAPLIGAHFFPSHDAIASLIGAYAGFAMGFAMRPIGGVLFGHIGDRIGRREAMVISVLLMGIATTLIGVLPTYGQVGIWAPVLLVVVRLFQGLSVGGEFTGSVSYLIETAPRRHRGLAGSFSNIGSEGGFLLAAGLAAATVIALQHDPAYSWIWRIPFLCGGVLAAISYWLRRQLPRSGFEPERRAQHQELPLKSAFKEAPRILALAVAFTWGYGIVYYLTLVFLPTFASKFGHLDAGEALSVNAVAQAVTLVLIPLSGWATDRFIRRRSMLILSFALFLVSAVGTFELAGKGDLFEFMIAQTALIIFLCIVLGTAPAFLAELFPSHFRVSAYSLSYNIGLGYGGGTAPLIATALIGAWGTVAAPAYLMLGAALALVALYAFVDRSREVLQ